MNVKELSWSYGYGFSVNDVEAEAIIASTIDELNAEILEAYGSAASFLIDYYGDDILEGLTNDYGDAPMVRVSIYTSEGDLGSEPVVDNDGKTYTNKDSKHPENQLFDLESYLIENLAGYSEAIKK